MSSSSPSVEEDWVKNFLIPKLLNDEKIIKKNDLNNFILRDITIKYLTTEEAFMLTKCYKLKINYEINGEQQTLALIVKKTPQLSEEVYKGVNFDELFHNEIFGYTEVIPLLNIKQNTPKYYYGHRKPNEAVLVLNDFSVDNWKMTKSKINLSTEHILLAAKAIGHFHGAGFALKHNEPDKFSNIVSKFRESRFVDDNLPEDWYTICTVSSQRSIAVTKKYQYLYDRIIPDEFLNKLLDLIGNSIQFFRKRVKPIEPIATICHGDYLRNNIAFKYKEDDSDTPTDIILFDFQTLRYSSPMLDLVILLSLSAGKDVRSTNFNKIFQEYWNELVKIFCERTNIKSQNLPSYLSYDFLLKEYARYLPYGLSIASSFLMVLFDNDSLPAEDILNGISRTKEEVIKDIFTLGGDALDMELAALVHELYEFTIKYDVNLFNEFN